MKKVLLLFPVFCMMLFSCIKTNNVVGSGDIIGGGSGTGGGTPTYFIKCKIAGVSKTFNVNMVALKPTVGGTQTLSINGNAASGSLESLGIAINNGPNTSANIGTGTYNVNTTSSFLTTAIYNAGSATNVWGAGISTGATNPFTVNITSLTTTAVTGSFQGDIVDNNGLGTNRMTITEGSFNVKF